jgi:hypothetical protein
VTWLLGLIVRAGVPQRFAKPVLYLAAALALLVAAIVALRLHDRRVVDQHEAKIEQRARPATDQAATERANDAIANAKNEQEAHDAIHAVPDAAPAAPSHALACERLRKLGRHPAACS